MQYISKDVENYISQLPEERKAPLTKIYTILKDNLPKGFEYKLSYGMPGVVIPFELYQGGYHCDPKLEVPFISVASQKNFVALYHSGIYAMPELYDWFISEFPKHSNKKLDMGKSCIRFKKMEDIPYELIKELCTKVTPEQYIEVYSKFDPRKN